MNTQNHSIFADMLEQIQDCLVVAILILCLCLPMGTQAQVTPGSQLVATNIPATMPANTASNFTSYVYIQQNAGLSLQWIFNGSAPVPGNVATNCTLYIYPSVDGTNAATTNAWALSAAYTGTTNVVATTNWSSATLSGYQGLFILSQTNGTGGTLTNKDLRFYRWNPPRAY